jgi:hypothetical protein
VDRANGGGELMADRQQLEFFLLQYAPHAVNGEAMNIGVVVMAPDRSFAEARFTRDWSRLRGLDPTVDLEMLASLARELREELRSDGKREQVLKQLAESFSNGVRVSAVKACLGESLEQEVEILARMYLDHPRERSRREVGARRKIVTQMQEAFTRAGIWRLMWKKIPAATYGRQGDPLTIDCGYKPNGIVRLFHAVAIGEGVDAAKVLAFSYPAVRAGIARELQAKCELTAIVDSIDNGDEQTEFALAALEQAEIRVASVEKIDEIAKDAAGSEW